MDVAKHVLEEVVLRKVIAEFRTSSQSIHSQYNAKFPLDANSDSFHNPAYKALEQAERSSVQFDLLSERHAIVTKYSADLRKCFRPSKQGLLDYIAFCDLDFEQADTVLVANLQKGIAQLDKIHWYCLLSVSEHFAPLVDGGRVGPFIFLKYIPHENGVGFREWLLADIEQDFFVGTENVAGTPTKIVTDQFAEVALNAMAIEGGYFALCQVHTGFVPNPHGWNRTSRSQELLALRCNQYYNLFRLALQWVYLPERGISSGMSQPLTEGQSVGLLLPSISTCSAQTTDSLWKSFADEFNWTFYQHKASKRLAGVMDGVLADYSNLLESESHNLIMKKLNDSISFVFSSFGMKGDDPIVGLIVAIESILNPFKRSDLPSSERLAKLGAALITNEESHRRTIYEDLRNAYTYRSRVLHSMEGSDIQLKLDDLTRDPTQQETGGIEDEPEPIPHHDQENMMFEYYVRLFVAVSRWLNDYLQTYGDQPDWKLRKDFEDYCASEMRSK